MKVFLSSTYLDLIDHYKAYCKGIKYNDGYDFSITFFSPYKPIAVS